MASFFFFLTAIRRYYQIGSLHYLFALLHLLIKDLEAKSLKLVYSMDMFWQGFSFWFTDCWLPALSQNRKRSSSVSFPSYKRTHWIMDPTLPLPYCCLKDPSLNTITLETMISIYALGGTQAFSRMGRQKKNESHKCCKNIDSDHSIWKVDKKYFHKKSGCSSLKCPDCGRCCPKLELTLGKMNGSRFPRMFLD